MAIFDQDSVLTAGDVRNVLDEYLGGESISGEIVADVVGSVENTLNDFESQVVNTVDAMHDEMRRELAAMHEKLDVIVSFIRSLRSAAA